MQAESETITIEPSIKGKIDELNKASFESRNRAPEDSISFANEALSLAEKHNYKKGKADALSNLAFQDIQLSQLEKGLELLLAAIPLFEELQDDVGMSNAQYNLGVLHMRFANFTLSVEALNKCIQIREKLGDMAGLASCYFQMGFIHQIFGNLDEALEMALKGLDIRKGLGDRLGIAALQSLIGDIYTRKGNYEAARENLYEALSMRGEKEDFRGYFSNLSKVMELHIACHEPEKALDWFNKSFPVVEASGDFFGMMRFYQIRGKVALQLGHTAEALDYYLKGLKIAEEKNFKSIIYEISQLLSDIYEHLDDSKNALAFYKKYHKLKEEVLSSQSSSQLKSIQLMNQISASKREAELERVRNVELKNAFDIIEEKNKDITDSIHSALRIQRAILPTNEEINRLLPESFILFKPRDIVSGDFYWISEIGDKTLLAAVDCTGHGVPGAFMSMIGNALLNQIVNEKRITAPCEVLFHLRESIIRSLKQTGAIGEGKEGMDIALCALDKKNNAVEFAGAHNPLWIFRKNGELEEINADKQPIGLQYDELKPFTNHTIKLNKGDRLYIFTDGYADQFGGPNGKKFKYKQLQEKLLTISHCPLAEQKSILENTFDNWKGNLEQIDDVLLIGIGI